MVVMVQSGHEVVVVVVVVIVVLRDVFRKTGLESDHTSIHSTTPRPKTHKQANKQTKEFK